MKNLEQCSRPFRIAFDLSRGGWTLSQHLRLCSSGSGPPQKISHMSPIAKVAFDKLLCYQNARSRALTQPLFHTGRCIFLVSAPSADRLLPSYHSSHLPLTTAYRDSGCQLLVLSESACGEVGPLIAFPSVGKTNMSSPFLSGHVFTEPVFKVV